MLHTKTKTIQDQVTDFIAVCGCLKSFEASNNWGSILFRMLKDVVTNAPSQDRTNEILDYDIPTANPRYDRNVAGLSRASIDTLEEIGLTLLPSKGNMTMFSRHEVAAELKDLSIVLKDGEKFITFLNTASAANLADENLTEGLSLAVRTFESRLIADDLNKPSDYTLELFKTTQKLIAALNVFNLTEVTDRLSNRFKQAAQGILRETVLAEKEQLLGSTSDSTFAAHSWHIDARPSFYTRKWSDALTTLEIISNNPKANELAKHGKEYLTASIAIARKEILELTAPPEVQGAFLLTLDRAEKRLAKVK